MKSWVVIPVRKLENAKSRLSNVLDEKCRREFSLRMLHDVLDSTFLARNVEKVLVVTPDLKVLEFSKSLGADVLFEEFEKGVNQAVSHAINYCMKFDSPPIFILPSDIPLIQPEDLDRVMKIGEKKPSVVISPSIRFDGTNLLFLNPPNIIKTFHYEQNSFYSHLVECFRLSVKVSVYVSKRVMLDIDCSRDLVEFLRFDCRKHSFRFLRRICLKF